jgi:hypothetical protein
MIYGNLFVLILRILMVKCFWIGADEQDTGYHFAVKFSLETIGQYNTHLPIRVQLESIAQFQHQARRSTTIPSFSEVDSHETAVLGTFSYNSWF